MARTAPVPNLPPIPGMCPSVAMAGGGGGSGGGSGSDAGSGKGKGPGSGGGGGDGAGADGKKATKGCTKKGEPVDVASGSVIHERVDFDIDGTFTLTWEATYLSSQSRRDDAGMGWGWAHSYSHHIEIRRDRLELVDGGGVRNDLPMISIGGRLRLPFGLTLMRPFEDVFVVDSKEEGLTREFRPVPGAAPETLQLVRVTSRYARSVELRYDDRARLVSLLDTVGREIKLARGQDGRISTIALPAPNGPGTVVVARYEYDDDGNQVRAVDPLGNARTYEYDQGHRLTAWTNRTGARVVYRYDDASPPRSIETWVESPGVPLGIAPSISKTMASPIGDVPVKGLYHRIFDYAEDTTSVYDTRGAVGRYYPNADGSIRKSVSPGGRVVTQQFDQYGQRTEMIDGAEALQRWTYDAEGRTTSHTDALGRVTRFQYGRGELAERIIAANGGEWNFVHTENSTTILDPLGSRVEYRRDERGLASATLRTGRPITRVRRGWHAKVEQLTIGSSVIRFEYDAWGRAIAMVEGDGLRSTLEFDLAGRVIRRRDPAGREARYEYDGEGNLITVAAPDGTVRRATYNAWGWLLSATMADGATTKLFYDHDGEIVEAHDPRGEAHKFAYNRDGWLVEATFPDGRIERYRYDKAGRCIQTRVNGLLRSECEFDHAGNLVKEEHEDGSVDTFEYDALDFMATATCPAAKVSFRRDLVGNVIEETIEVGKRRFTVVSTMGPSGDRRRRDVGGVSTGIERSQQGDVIGRWLDDELEELEFNELGRLSRMSRRQGLVIEREYDVLGYLQREKVSRPTAARLIDEGLTEMAALRPVIDRSFEYTGHRELERVRDAVAGEEAVYRYDPFGRLISASDGKAPPQTFSHDLSSNLVGVGSEARVFGPGGRMTEAGDYRLTFDELGRLIEKRKIVTVAHQHEQWWKYEWSPYGLKTALSSSGARITFEYDALGRRVAKRAEGGDQVLFVWDANSLAQEHVLARDGTTKVKTHVFDDDEPFLPVAVKSDDEWFDVLSTPAGLPMELVDGQGNVAWALRTTPYGSTLQERTPRGLGYNLRFQGQYRDAETGLHYNRFRTYDPELGIYIQPDPIGPEGDLNGYAYCRNPIGWVDPLGLENGAALKASMVAAGQPACPPGFQAHHLIPEELYNTHGYKGLLGGSKAAHSADNGIYLPDSQGSFNKQLKSGNKPQPPGQTIHNGKHSSAYKNYVKSELDRIKGLPECQQQPALVALKQDLQDKMQNGTFEGKSTSGKDVKGLNKKGNVVPPPPPKPKRK